MLQDIIDRSLFSASATAMAVTNSLRNNNNSRLAGSSQFGPNNTNGVFPNGFSGNNSNYFMQNGTSTNNNGNNNSGASAKKNPRFSGPNGGASNIGVHENGTQRRNSFDIEDQQHRSNSLANVDDTENNIGTGVTVLAKKFVLIF